MSGDVGKESGDGYMNTVGLYQNYMTSFQNMQKMGRSEKKTAEKPAAVSAYQKPEAVYERTSTDEDIRKMMEKKEKEATVKAKKEEGTDVLEKFTIAKKSDVKLSDKAQDLLEKLKEKYGNMDFFVADFSTDEEAQQYLVQGTKEYSVVIDPDTLEKMAEDEETFQKYDSILASAGDTFEEVKEQLGEDAEAVVNLGITMDGDGNVTLFAELDKQTVKQAEAQKKLREQQAADKKEKQAAEKEKAAEKKEQEKAEAKKESKAEQLEALTKGSRERETFRVTGSTVEDLVTAIKDAMVA